VIRGCNPAPGAWSTLDGKTLKIFEAKPMPAKDPKGIAGKMGEIVAVEADGITVCVPMAASRFCAVQADGPQACRRRMGQGCGSRDRGEAHMTRFCRPCASGDPRAIYP